MATTLTTLATAAVRVVSLDRVDTHPRYDHRLPHRRADPARAVHAETTPTTLAVTRSGWSSQSVTTISAAYPPYLAFDRSGRAT
jgi:hypothetical protein